MIQLDHPELYEVLEARSGAGQPDHDPSNPVAAWDCDPSRSYQVAFYHESHWYAYGRTNGYATPQGGIAYPGRDLYMEGGANSFAVRYYNVGGTQTLYAPIVRADFNFDFDPQSPQGESPPYWEFMVLLWIPPVVGPGDPGDPCPPDATWPYTDPVINVATNSGIVPHRRTVGSAFR